MREEIPSRRYVAFIAVIAGAVLVIGATLKPTNTSPEPAVSSMEMARLQSLAQRRYLEDMAGFISETAAGVVPHLVHLKATGDSGLVWTEEGSHVTAGTRKRFPDSVVLVSPTGMETEAITARVSPDLPLVTLEGTLLPRQRPVVLRSPEALHPGEWVLAVWLLNDGNHSFVPGWYSGTVSSSCGTFPYRRVLTTLPLNASMRGGGVFDLDGNLVAVIVQCDGLAVAMAPEDVASAQQQAALLERRLLRHYGMRLAGLDEALREYFQTEIGLLVTEVWKGYRAEAVGLLPGDLLVQLNDHSVETLPDLEILVEKKPERDFQLVVRRDRKELSIQLPSSELAVLEDSRQFPRAGVVLQTDVPGYVIEAVKPGSRAAEAGIRPGDRLLRVADMEANDPQTHREALASLQNQPIFLVLERSEKKMGVFLP